MRVSLCLVALFFSLAGAELPASAQTASALAPSNNGAGAAAFGVPVELKARLQKDGEPIERGMTWRVFGRSADADGKLPLIASAQGGSARFQLPSGTYLVHAAYGRAGATRQISVAGDGVSEDVVLKAGGLRLSATIDGAPIAGKHLRFSIYERKQDADGERKLIALNVEPDKVIRLNEGTYHVLSRYGVINATVRADLRVKAGKLTKATLQHRGAEVSMRLVSEPGGAPIANTAWSVFTQDGEKVFSSNNTAPSLVLAEGEYEAAVQYGAETLRRDFTIEPGKHLALEIQLEDG